nr:hypothetical protein 11 [Deltaproteobacteria bacterium]
MSCAKLQVIALLVSPKGEIFVGTNWCHEPQEVCPRADLPSGVGYEMCENVCKQHAHAEVDACIQAGEAARGSKVYLIGHSYACDDCMKVMAKHGVETVHIIHMDNAE